MLHCSRGNPLIGVNEVLLGQAGDLLTMRLRDVSPEQAAWRVVTWVHSVIEQLFARGRGGTRVEGSRAAAAPVSPSPGCDVAKQGHECLGDAVGLEQRAKVTGRQRTHGPTSLRGGLTISGVGVAEGHVGPG